MNFEAELPKMCVRDDEHMNKHLAVKKDGKILSVLGIYPLLTNICGEEILCATVGNVATLPEEEGKGYMNMLLNKAMEELENMGVAFSRLAGNRMRYNRFGYEYAGFSYNFDIYKELINKKIKDFKSDISFVKVNETDYDILSKMKKIYELEKFAVVRDDESFFKTLRAWQFQPYAALTPDGNVIGYLSVSENNDNIAELLALSSDLYREILIKWISDKSERKVTISLMPHKSAEIKIVSEFCQSCTVSNPSMFKIINWEKIVNAFFRLKAEYTNIADGKLIIGIENYGNLLLTSETNVAVCKKTECTPDITLSYMQAVNLLFGLYPQNSILDFSHHFLPLPISWTLLDRV